jgi:hypothetical protein
MGEARAFSFAHGQKSRVLPEDILGGHVDNCREAGHDIEPSIPGDILATLADNDAKLSFSRGLLG